MNFWNSLQPYTTSTVATPPKPQAQGADPKAFYAAYGGTTPMQAPDVQDPATPEQAGGLSDPQRRSLSKALGQFSQGLSKQPAPQAPYAMQRSANTYAPGGATVNMTGGR